MAKKTSKSTSATPRPSRTTVSTGSKPTTNRNATPTKTVAKAALPKPKPPASTSGRGTTVHRPATSAPSSTRANQARIANSDAANPHLETVAPFTLVNHPSDEDSGGGFAGFVKDLAFGPVDSAADNAKGLLSVLQINADIWGCLYESGQLYGVDTMQFGSCARLYAINYGNYLLARDTLQAAAAGDWQALWDIGQGFLPEHCRTGQFNLGRCAGYAIFEAALTTITGGLGKVDNLAEVGTDLRKGDNLPSCPNSFVPGTFVLLANGTTKSIEDIAVGDLVWAADPKSGEAGPREVTALIEGHGDKILIDIQINGDIVTPTDKHPIWVDSQGRWLDAEDIKPGDLLLDDSGATLVVGDVTTRHVTSQTVHNLTIADLHSYFVAVGGEEVLVHNCLENQMADLLDDELATATRLGVKPTEVGSAGFDAVADGGRMKFAVLQDGRVVVQPVIVSGQEISHAVLSGGSPVRVAGHVDVAGSGGDYFGLFINANSGHFGVGSLEAAKEAFARYGIHFD